MHEIGSYIDLENDQYGLVCSNKYSLIAEVEKMVLNEFDVPIEQIAGEQYFVHYRDEKNCERIFENILRLQNAETTF